MLALRGASAEALAELGKRVGRTGTLGEAAAMGEELFGVARLLRHEPALRRVATDASVDGEAKAGLMKNVLAGSLGDDAMGLVGDAVQHRWTASRDLGGVLEQLAARSTVYSAGAKAGQISDELFAVGRLIDGDDALRTALSDPARSVEDKSTLLRELLDGRALPATVRLVEEAATGARGSVTAAIAEYRHVAAEEQGETLATVRTAKPLTSADVDRLTESLGRQYDTSIHLNVVVEPALLGGLRVEIGHDVIDGTVVGKLDEARRRLVG